MKIRENEQGMVEIQLKPKEKYKLVFHRINKGKYEQYVKLKDGIYILNLEELKQVKEFIESRNEDVYGNK